MMKKILIPALAATLLAVSCKNDDYGNAPNTRSIAGTVPAVVMPASTSEEPILTLLPIKLTQYLNKAGVWTVDVKGLQLPENKTLTFSSPEVAGATDGSYNSDIRLRFNSNFSAEGGQLIRDLKVDMINNYYYLSFNGSGSAAPLGTLVAANFKVDADYTVTTFPTQAFYGGTTVTTYELAGAEKEFKNEVPMYQVIVDMSKRTAKITIFNAKFAEEMPQTLSAVILEGLTISASKEHGYVIAGKNIVPKVGVGASQVEYPQFKFDNIELYPINSGYTQCSINYIVAGKYKGTFTGAYPVVNK